MQHRAVIGRELREFASVPSTNTVAAALARSGAAEGLCVIADEQTGGRGRAGRTWTSPPGVNLYLSVILRPAVLAAEAPRVTITAGVAVAEAVAHYCPADVSIKWPNDILIRGKKVSGILTEMTVRGDGSIDFIIVGIGVNINSDGNSLGPALRHRAISIREVVGGEVSRHEVRAAVLSSFDRWYRTLVNDGFGEIRAHWLRRAAMIGKEVTVRDGGAGLSGIAEDIDMTGALVLCDRTSSRRHVIAGDIVITGE